MRAMSEYMTESEAYYCTQLWYTIQQLLSTGGNGTS